MRNDGDQHEGRRGSDERCGHAHRRRKMRDKERREKSREEALPAARSPLARALAAVVVGPPSFGRSWRPTTSSLHRSSWFPLELIRNWFATSCALPSLSLAGIGFE